MKLIQLFSIIYVFSTVDCGIYLHNPRGSNNRYNDNGRELKNKNRLFDSQNNDRGGYNVGNLYYYTKSILSIEWTNDNSCGESGANCDVILQYMCHDKLRDGSSTSTIPNNNAASSNYIYGMHETIDSYRHCDRRERNKGLYEPSRITSGDSAKYTRQNPSGERFGLECPEERDYFPYWSSTQWRDIAVLTSRPERCPFYRAESQNVKGRYSCRLPDSLGMALIPISKQKCESLSTKVGNTTQRGEWIYEPAFDLPPPVCHEPDSVRDNYLGNVATGSGQPANFNWTIPDLPAEFCTLRVRYNVTYTSSNPDTKRDGEWGPPTEQDIWKASGISNGSSRGYKLVNSPQVSIFSDILNFKLQLAINTQRIGRVFEDRSHRFAIRKRPADIPTSSILHNLNVRGKRGNIVQVFPATEYDFVPNTLSLAVGDYVHFQWTGSDNNPNNNDGEGRASTDRSNLVLQGPPVYPEYSYPSSSPFMWGRWGRSYPDIYNITDENLVGSIVGLSLDDVRNLAYLSSNQMGGDMTLLDDAGTYFDLGPRKVTSTGVGHYLCTRNNNFSNRSQKGRLICSSHVAEYFSIGVNGGTLSTANNVIQIAIAPNSISSLTKFKVEMMDKADMPQFVVSSSSESNEDMIPLFSLQPDIQFTTPAEVTFLFTPPDGMDSVRVYHSIGDGHVWQYLESDTSSSTSSVHTRQVTFKAPAGGYYVARYSTSSSTGLIVGLVIAFVVVGLLVAGLVVYIYRNPGMWRRLVAGVSSSV